MGLYFGALILGIFDVMENLDPLTGAQGRQTRFERNVGLCTVGESNEDDDAGASQ